MKRLIALLAACCLAAPTTAQNVAFAYPGIGTSGARVPLLNGTNTWSGKQFYTYTGSGGTDQGAIDVGAGTAQGIAFGTTGGSIAGDQGNGSLSLYTSNHGTAIYWAVSAQNTLRFGRADAATADAQTFVVMNVVAGTSNTAGADWTFSGSRGTGTGAGGSIIWKTAPAGSTGTSQNALVTGLTLNSAGVLANPTIGTDAGLTDTSVCQDTTTHVFKSGTGTLGICLGTSSARFKHDIEPLTAGLAEIMRLRPVSYQLNADHGDPNKTLYGFTAEDMQPVLPKLVGLDNKGKPNSADYMGLVPVLVKAVQQLQGEVEALKARIARDDLLMASAHR